VHSSEGAQRASRVGNSKFGWGFDGNSIPAKALQRDGETPLAAPLSPQESLGENDRPMNPKSYLKI